MSFDYLSASDEELLAAYYGCDAKAFGMLWLGQKKPRRVGYQIRLDRYLAKRFPLLREHDREDLVSEVGLVVAHSKESGKFEAGRRFRPWVFTVAHRKAVDFFKRRGNQAITGAESEEGVSLNPPDERIPASYGLEDATVQAAYDAIDRLPPLQRDVLLLRLNFLTNQDVAHVLGISQPEASKYYQKALENLGNAMTEHKPNADESLHPVADRLFRRLQERHDNELAVALERMQRHNLELDAAGRIVGFTKAVQSGEVDFIAAHLRGVLPLYLLRQGVPTTHANAFDAFVQARLNVAHPVQRFRDTLARYLAEFCAEKAIVPQPAKDETEFLHRLLCHENEGVAWAAEMKAWLPQGTIRKLDDLVNPLQWPASLSEDRSFKSRMRQLHAALLATMKSESDLLNVQA